MERAHEEEINQLIKKARDGDKEAFGVIYGSFQIRIYRFIYSLIGNRPTAEDLTQMTFLRIWNALPDFDSTKGTFTAYLFSSARHIVIDWQRKKKELPLAQALGAETPDDSVEQIVRHDRKRLVKTIIRGLSAENRQLVILRYFEELPFAQIAQIVGKTEVGVRVTLHRILGELRRKLKGRYEP